MTIENGISTIRSVHRTFIQVFRVQIQDVKFVDDHNLMLATKDDCKSSSIIYLKADCANLTTNQHHLIFSTSGIEKPMLIPKD